MNRFRVKAPLGNILGEYATVGEAFEKHGVPVRTAETIGRTSGPKVMVVDGDGREFGPVLRP